MVYYLNKYYQSTDAFIGPWTIYVQFEGEVDPIKAFHHATDDGFDLDPDSFKTHGDYWEMKADRGDMLLTMRMGKLGVVTL